MPARHFIWAVLLLWANAASAQQPAAAQPAARAAESRGYAVFAGGSLVGREDVTVQSSGNALTITGKGRLTGSQDVVLQRVDIRYRPDGTAERFELEGSVDGGPATLSTTFSGTTAATKGVDRGQQVERTDTVGPQAIVLSNVFFASYEVLARRLVKAEAGQEFSVFVTAGMVGTIRLVNSATERAQVGTRSFDVRRYGLALTTPRGETPLIVYADEAATLMRISIPGQGVEVVRDDLAAATSRTNIHSNPNDEAVNIPSAGFNLGATLTLPAVLKSNNAARVPAVILLAGVASNERDGLTGGVPVLGQLAAALAESGVLAVRFDKRGHGQSGGRAESATLADHAEDAIAVFRWLSNRKDVDRDRIAVIGHNEGGWIALLAATRERRIAAVATIAAPSTSGNDWWLERQGRELDRLNLSPGERASKVEEQRRINAAVTTGKGWEGIAPELRKQAETPWFQSILMFEPARVLRDVRQPVLVLHGALDGEVPVAHADRLAELAQKEGRSRAVAVVTVREVNHLLIRAITGDPREYATLQDRTLSVDAGKALTGWLTKTFEAIR